MANNIEYWEAMRRQMPLPYQEWLAGELPFLERHIPKDSKVIEVGCGTGRTLENLVTTTKKLVGIDHDPEAIALAKKRLIPQIQLRIAEATNLPFESNSFDYALCLASFANLADIKYAALEEMKRVTKNTGKIIVSCYSEDALPARIEMYKKQSAPIRQILPSGTVIFDFDGDNISEQFSREDIQTIAKKSGLRIDELTKIGIGYYCALSK